MEVEDEHTTVMPEVNELSGKNLGFLGVQRHRRQYTQKMQARKTIKAVRKATQSM
jgi:hypothetical protein